VSDNPKKRAGRFAQWNKARQLKAEQRRLLVAELTEQGLSEEEIRLRTGMKCTKTIKLDQEANVDFVREKGLPHTVDAQIAADARLRGLDDDLESALENGEISMSERISLALDILKSRRDLLGLDAPRKIESHNTNVEVSVEPNLYTWCFQLFNRVTNKEALKAECERIAATFREDVKPIEVPAHILSDGGKNVVS
jgi:hypothetical protein